MTETLSQTGVATLDAVLHTWCPACRAEPGEPCRATKAATEEYLGAVQTNPSATLRIRLHVDHDGATEAHLSRIRRADDLADGNAKWRLDELEALVLPMARNGALFREGRADFSIDVVDVVDGDEEAARG